MTTPTNPDALLHLLQEGYSVLVKESIVVLMSPDGRHVVTLPADMFNVA
jgi:hypothetical protein